MFCLFPDSKSLWKKWATGQSFIRKEITSYRIGTLAVILIICRAVVRRCCSFPEDWSTNVRRCTKKFSALVTLLTAEDFRFFCDLYLQFIDPILEQMHWFEAVFEGPFLRPMRSKNDQCWILRLRPQNFVIISESLAANLEKVRQASVWQTVPKFWFIWLWYLSFSITYKSKSLRNNK